MTKIFLDSVDIKEITYWNRLGVIAGVTTNPALLSSYKNEDPINLVKKISNIIYPSPPHPIMLVPPQSRAETKRVRPVIRQLYSINKRFNRQFNRQIYETNNIYKTKIYGMEYIKDNLIKGFQGLLNTLGTFLDRSPTITHISKNH